MFKKKNKGVELRIYGKNEHLPEHLHAYDDKGKNTFSIKSTQILEAKINLKKSSVSSTKKYIKKNKSMLIEKFKELNSHLFADKLNG